MPLVLPVAVDRRPRRVRPQHLADVLVGARPHPDRSSARSITVMILVGATLLSAASPRLRQSAITLVGAGVHPRRSCRAVGSCSGTRSRRRPGPTSLPATLKTTQTLTVTAAPGRQVQVRARRARRPRPVSPRSTSRSRRRATRSTSQDADDAVRVAEPRRGRHARRRRRVLPASRARTRSSARSPATRPRA